MGTMLNGYVHKNEILTNGICGPFVLSRIEGVFLATSLLLPSELAERATC